MYRPRLPDMDRLALLVFLTLLAILIAVLMAAPSRADEAPAEAPPLEGAQEAPGASPVEAQVTERIRAFVASVCRGRATCLRLMPRTERWRRAPALAHLIVTEAQARDLDPYLATILVECESSYREGGPRGAAGEQGLLQIMGVAVTQALRAGHDLTTSEGQIRGGLDRLARAREACGDDPLRQLTHYQMGRCRADYPGPARRVERLEGWLSTLPQGGSLVDDPPAPDEGSLVAWEGPALEPRFQALRP